jgi:hypothetical protein
VCAEEAPPLQVSEEGHWTACHFPGEMPVEQFTGLHPNEVAAGALSESAGAQT